MALEGGFKSVSDNRRLNRLGVILIAEDKGQNLREPRDFNRGTQSRSFIDPVRICLLDRFNREILRQFILEQLERIKKSIII